MISLRTLKTGFKLSQYFYSHGEESEFSTQLEGVAILLY